MSSLPTHLDWPLLTAIASAILTFADPSDVDAVRRILYNAQGLLQERLILVELPSTLYAGFYWTLKQLQIQSQNEERLAFLPLIAPWVPGESPEVSPPKYASVDGFAYQLDVLRQKGSPERSDLLTLSPNDLLADKQVRDACIETLCSETTLDRGQAIALCDTLCRGLAFTQGPPGTGKTQVSFLRSYTQPFSNSKQIPWRRFGEGTFSIPRPKADPCSVHDQPRPRQLPGRPPKIGNQEAGSTRWSE